MLRIGTAGGVTPARLGYAVTEHVPTESATHLVLMKQ